MSLPLTLWWSFVGVALVLIGACEISSFFSGVPTVTSVPSIRRKMIEILKREAAERGGTMKIVDLGSGTGKLALQIGKALPSATVLGFEISPVPYFFSRVRKALWRVPNVTFKREDFWAFDTAPLDAVTLYMNANIRQRMADKLKKELRPGALVISNETYMPGWEPVETYRVGLFKVALVVYRQV